MKIKSKYSLIFFATFILVVIALGGGIIYKKYRDEGNILGYKIERIGKTYYIPPTPRPTVTLIPAPPTFTPVVTPTDVPVSPLIKYEIKLISFPEKAKLNENATFTWQVNGQNTIIGYTSIVGAKDIKSGSLSESDNLAKTPYKELVKEFTNGSFNIPLNFIGNTYFPEYGKYYLRALAVINGKNIWSDEFTVLVE